MPTVETTITLSIPEEGMSWEALEAAVAQEVRRAAQELLVAGRRAMEAQLLEQMGPRLRRDKERPLDLLTRFGEIRLKRWYVQKRTTGGYRYPLDELLGLRPRQHASPWVSAQAVALATRVPYRQAALLLGEMVGGFVDHRTVYAWVQQAGVRVVAEAEDEQEAVFGRGEVPPCGTGERELVVAEVDGTFIKAQREEVPDFAVPASGMEVRLGVLYRGKALESSTAKHRRYRLLVRLRRNGGVESANDFGERLFLAGERRLALTRARSASGGVVGDGASWIEALAGHQSA